MNSSFDNSSQEAISPSPSPNQSHRGITPISQAIYSIVSIAAFFGNILVILVFVWDKKLLKKSYNVLILCLAISDVLTALLLITNPAFVLGDSFPYPTNHRVLGELFCRLVWSRALLFQLVTFSVYICLALAAERWFAVVKPYQYSDVFGRRNVVCYIFISWICAFAVAGTGIIESMYSPRSPTQICKYEFIGKGSVTRVLLGIFQVTMKMFLPCFILPHDPEERKFRNPGREGLGKHNYCRNPRGKRARPWCYTTLKSPVWQYCDIVLCNRTIKDGKEDT